MRIAYIGRVTLSVLSEHFRFDRPLPPVRWGFPLGAEIVCGLVKRGHHVSVVVNDNHSDCMEVYHSKGCDVYIVPDRKRTRWQFLTLFSKEVRGMRECVKQIKPDVVFAQWTYFYAYAGLTSGYPTLVVAHDSPWRIAMVEKSPQSLIKAFYAQFFVFPRVRHITTVSPYIVDELHRWNHYKGEVKVVPNGIGLQNAMNANPRTPIRAQATTVVCVSDWSALKNVKTFFSALEYAEKKLSRLRAIVFGSELSWDGAAGRYLRSHGIHIEGLELRGLVSRKEIDRVLCEEADLFVSPSLEESFGMVFVEAMRLGLPCIGGERSGAVPWVMGEGGVVCDVSKPEKLAECIERVMGDFELRKRLSAGGIKHVGEMFDIDKVVAMYEKELETVAAGR